jgi:hypothetical protein
LVVPGVERFGPGGVFAHDDGGGHVELVDQCVLRGIAHRLGEVGGGEVGVEDVLPGLVVGVDVFGEFVGGGTGDHVGLVQAGGPGFEGEGDFADEGADHGDGVILLDHALERPDGVGGREVVVLDQEVDLAAIDAAFRVDLLGGEGGTVGDGLAGDGAEFGGDADGDRRRRVGGGEREDGRDATGGHKQTVVSLGHCRLP